MCASKLSEKVPQPESSPNPPNGMGHHENNDVNIMQQNIGNQPELLEEHFEDMLENDERFEICSPVTMGLVCFR